MRVLGKPLKATEANADDIRSQQASHVAQIIISSAGENAANQLRVYDREQRRTRGAQLRDISILIRSRTGLGVLTRELEDAGIPYRLEGGSLLFDTQEVQDLLNCLRAIDDPTDEVSVVAALRSPAFACSDVDPAPLAGRRWTLELPIPVAVRRRVKRRRAIATTRETTDRGCGPERNADHPRIPSATPCR